MKIRQIKEVEIMSIGFKITYDKTTDGGSFDCNESRITIGIKHVATDPLYTFSVISHEIMEIILLTMGARFGNGRTADNYLFNFDHQTFENAIQVHAQVISKFIK